MSSVPSCVDETNMPDPAIVEGLETALGLWKWTTELEAGDQTELDACDSSIAYRVGPEVFLDSAADYATCAIARGEIIEVSSGNLDMPNTCIALSCTGKIGVIWGSATSGSIFQLDEGGQTVGVSMGQLWLRPGEDLQPHLVWGGSAALDSGYIMNKQLGDTTALECQ
jgi:hypothetical protein